MPGYELIGKEELDEIKEIFNNGGILFRHGFDNLRGNTYKVKEFEKKFSQEIPSNHCLAVTSGTAALRVALSALELQPDDEIITQAFTFVATVEAIIESRARPVCANIDNTLNLCPQDFRNRITNKTKAVIVVHMLGVPARLDEIKSICDEHNITLIEDTAWGCGGSFQNIKLGTYGDIGTFSFDFAKTITTGEGGMISFKDEVLFKKAAAWHDHGHENNPMVPRWEDTRSSSGFNYRMMELQGAVGLAQLKKLSFVVDAQRKNRDLIVNELKTIKKIVFREIPKDSFDTADALVFFVDSNSVAKKCRDSLLKIGISTKILPEAYTWHFAGTWNHMKELSDSHNNDLINDLKKSHEILSRSVAIPINVKMDAGMENEIFKAISTVII